MHPDPYIGVTGFMAQEEVAAALEEFATLSNWRECKLMVGILASSKTLAGKPNKWPNRYPAMAAIAGLFPQGGPTVNLIHYATEDRSSLRDQLEQMIAIGGPCLHGFQLNIRWPEPESIAFLKGRRVVLQIGRGALDQLDNEPGVVAAALDAYKEVITDVLVDASGGRGIPIDTASARTYVEAISRRHPDIGIGVAGGLSAETIFPLYGLAHAFPMLSIDAEGKLRTAEDRLHIQSMRDYLNAADDLFE